MSAALQIGIGDRIEWYGRKGTVIGYIPANSKEIRGCIGMAEVAHKNFDISKTRNETSYVILRDQPKHSNARPQLFRPWNVTMRKLEK